MIRNFWLSHPEYWIPIGQKQQEADRIIYNSFKDYNPDDEDKFGIIIYFDQFLRHFSRIEPISETVIQEGREYAVHLVESMNLRDVPENELVWYLMPWKHLRIWQPIFQRIFDWLDKKPINKFPILNKFFMDTYKKAFNQEQVAKSLVLSDGLGIYPYNATEICDEHPNIFKTHQQWLTIPIPQDAKPLTDTFLDSKQSPLTISLSGGVDSMLLCALLKRTGYNIIAVHIIYGNRSESHEECAFIRTYCHRLGIPLYLYTIEWLRRDAVDREFYEEMTRALRFMCYKALNRPVVLGHIQDDVIENIWTNFAKGTHLDNLAKISPIAWEDGVEIRRPWLSVKKSLIYSIAKQMVIPFLKNTTPAWSNRGKFRTNFLDATRKQYGETVDDKVIEVAERLTEQAKLLERVLFQPIYASWDSQKKRLNITQAINAGLDVEGWLRIFTEITHKYLDLKKPSIKACQNFVARCNKHTLNKGIKITLRCDLSVRLVQEATGVWLVFDLRS